MLHLLTLSTLLLSECYSAIVEHNDIGVIEHADKIHNEHQNTTLHPESLVRRLIPGGFTTQDKIQILEAHNRYRTLTAQGSTYGQPSASNMNQLLWDTGLEKIAQDYSAKCIWAHNSNRNSDMANNADLASFDYTNQPVGENLFLTSASENLAAVLQGIQYWYDEYTYYTYGVMSTSGSCQSGQQCGHYTQLVWGNTRYVGCGYTKCPSVSGGFGNSVLLVCNYYFAGNIIGNYPYKVGSSATACGSDRSSQDGLCSGCPSPYWDSYCCEYCSSGTCSNAKYSGLLNAPSSCTDGLGDLLAGLGSASISVPSPSNPPSNPPTAKPTTSSPTAKPTTNSPTPKPVSPTSKPVAPTPKPVSVIQPKSDPSNTDGCCTVNSNNRYASFCRSISYEGLCQMYSAICTWDDSC
jgi:hypothetical protein